MAEDARALATVATIDALEPIEGADKIELATVRGWQVVTQKGQYKVGDKTCYLEVDSAIPISHPAFDFLVGRSNRPLPDGTVVHVLKTIKLRGQYSQGLIVPLDQIGVTLKTHSLEDGTDLTDFLGVTLWERNVPRPPGTRGTRPSWIPKSDEERVQNYSDFFTLAKDQGLVLEAVEKADGSSLSVYVEGEKEGVSSRNMDLDETDSPWWAVPRSMGLFDLLHKAQTQYGETAKVCVQGELYGVGYNGNNLRLTDVRFGAFAFYVNGDRIAFDAWPVEFQALRLPVYPFSVPETVAEAVAQVDKLKSLINPVAAAEGVVWTARNVVEMRDRKGHRQKSSVKVISPGYAMKNDGVE